MAEQIWCYADEEDAERWRGRCATREAAIAEAPDELGLMPGDTFWISAWVPCDKSKFLPTPDDVIEGMNDRAYDDGHEDPEIETDAAGEAELKALLAAWCDKHVVSSRMYDPDGDPERCQVPAEDVAAELPSTDQVKP